MKSDWHCDRVANGNVVWEHRVERSDQLPRFEIAYRRKTDDLPGRVDPGIGATRSGNPFVRSRHLQQGRLERSLYRPTAALRLETREVRSVVRDGQTDNWRAAYLTDGRLTTPRTR